MIFLGIYPEAEALKIAKVRKERSRFFIDSLSSLPLSSAKEFVNPLYNLEYILGGQPTVVTCVCAKEIFMRSIEIKLLDKRKILNALPFELEDILPYPFEQAIVTPFIEKIPQTLSSKVRIFSTQKRSIEDHELKMKELDIDSEHITSIPSALRRFVSFVFNEKLSTFCFYISSEESIALCLIRGEIEISYSFDFCLSSIQKALAQDHPELKEDEIKEMMLHLDFFSITAQESPHMFDLLFSLQKEICRILYYFASKPISKEIKDFVLAGSFSSCNHLQDYLESLFPEEFSPLPLFPYAGFDATTLQNYAIPLGSALEAAIVDGQSLQLRQRQFLSKKMINKHLKKLSLTALAGFSFFLSLTIGINLLVKKEERALAALCKAYFPLAEKKDATSILEDVQKSIVKEKKNISLSCDAPVVSELLSYLSHHPLLQSKQSSFIPVDRIDIVKIHYELQRPPRLGTPSSPQVKVDMDFICSSSRAAKEFVDALKKGDHFVDGKKEVGFQVKDSVYKISFYLKSKGGSL